MNIWLISSGALAMAITGLHIFGGGPTIVRPLLQASDIPDGPKYVNYYCWHLVTFNLALMGVVLIVAGLGTATVALGWVGAASAGFYCLWGVVLAPLKGQSYKNVPQGWFFLPVFILATAGLAL